MPAIVINDCQGRDLYERGQAVSAHRHPLIAWAHAGIAGMLPAPGREDADMNVPMDLAEVAARVKEKRQNFREYNFGTLKDDALMTFYDLAQEYETIENFYRVTVWVIKEFFDLDSRLYLLCCRGPAGAGLRQPAGALSRQDLSPCPHPSGQSGLLRRRLLDPHPGQPAPGEPAALLRQGPDHRHAGILSRRPDLGGGPFFLRKVRQPPGLQPARQDHRPAEHPAYPLHQQPGGRYRTQRHHPQYQPQPLPEAFAQQDQEPERTGVRLQSGSGMCRTSRMPSRTSGT